MLDLAEMVGHPALPNCAHLADGSDYQRTETDM